MRRFGAIIYDFLIAVAVYMFAGAIGFAIAAVLSSVGVIDVGEGDLAAAISEQAWLSNLYQAWIAFWVVGFYVWFWSRGGQTLGMRAWRLKVQHVNGQCISLPRAITRFFASLLGLGNLFILLNKDKRALQDTLSETEVVVLSMQANQLKNWNGV
ncbi:RDD family protein [Paraferrimonas haliotis]|uniref:RDD family protein n=2 Tax=Paraferrimonas haliotis TaxID=2013866 RepID=A0AA37TNW2_9GAMM|nr:RDD family protein [Paraferrimonas haliotis]